MRHSCFIVIMHWSFGVEWFIVFFLICLVAFGAQCLFELKSSSIEFRMHWTHKWNSNMLARIWCIVDRINCLEFESSGIEERMRLIFKVKLDFVSTVFIKSMYFRKYIKKQRW